MQNKRVFKQTRVLSGAKKYRKWEGWEIGDILIGEYTGTHVDQYKKSCPVVKVVDAQFKDGSGDDEFKSDTILVLNNCGMLMKSFEQLEFGNFFQLEYTGMSTIEKGPYADKEAHTMKVIEVELDESGSDADVEL